MKKLILAGILGLLALCISPGDLLAWEPIMLTGQVNLETDCSGSRLISVSLYLFRDRTPVEDALVRLDETFTVPYSGSGVYFLKMKYPNLEPGLPFTITIEAAGLAQPITVNGDFAALLSLSSPAPESVIAVSEGIPFKACWRLAGEDSVRIVIKDLADSRGNVTLVDRIVPGSCFSLPGQDLFQPQGTYRIEVSQELDACNLGGDYFPGSEVVRSVSAGCAFRTR
jgi:hypothetical protein